MTARAYSLLAAVLYHIGYINQAKYINVDGDGTIPTKFAKVMVKFKVRSHEVHFLLLEGGFAMGQYIIELMPMIVEALLDGAAAVKREVAVTTLGQVVQHRVPGIMGALDPYMQKRNLLSLPDFHGKVGRAASDPGQHIMSMDVLPMDLWLAIVCNVRRLLFHRFEVFNCLIHEIKGEIAVKRKRWKITIH